MEKVFIKRHPDAPEKVPVPSHLHTNGRSPYLAEEGEEMVDCTWWRRRERERDVVIGKDKAEADKLYAAIVDAKKTTASPAKEAPRASKASE